MSAYEGRLRSLEARGFGIKPGLERMQGLVELLDDPQLNYPTIHIAGTNGKTSTARMAGAILAAHGVKSGVYTSPHLQSLRERFLLAGPAPPLHPEDGAATTPLSAESIISEQEFSDLFDYLDPFVKLVEDKRGEQVTYFELTTLAAFEWMSDKVVAAGIFETGLGGRWDATNLVESKVAVLTHIGVDHREYLGDTAAENAAEKTGIIKPGSMVVSDAQDEDVRKVLEEAAARRDATVAIAGRDFLTVNDSPALAGRLVSVQTQRAEYKDLFLPLFGRHQSQNLALAIAGAEAFRDEALDEDALSTALASIKVPGRLEVVRRSPLVVLDGAHNPAAAEALAASITEAFGARPVTLVASIFKDKDAPAILARLAPKAARVILTRSSSPRAADPRELANLMPGNWGTTEVVEPLAQALEQAISTSEDDEVVLVTGSLFAVGEARGHLAGLS